MASTLSFVALLLICGCCFAANPNNRYLKGVAYKYQKTSGNMAKKILVYKSNMNNRMGSHIHKDQVDCPEGWTAFESECFGFYNETKAWSDAEAFCQTVGANLASIDKSEENDFVMELVGETVAWIGGYYDVEEDEWTWSDDTEFGYSQWAAGEPHNTGGAKSCMEISPEEEGWKDVDCNIMFAFVCEKDM